jgi:hypothetical protein
MCIVFILNGLMLFPLKLFAKKVVSITFITVFLTYEKIQGARGSVVVKALCYKPEGRGFET